MKVEAGKTYLSVDGMVAYVGGKPDFNTWKESK